MHHPPLPRWLIYPVCSFFPPSTGRCLCLLEHLMFCLLVFQTSIVLSIMFRSVLYWFCLLLVWHQFNVSGNWFCHFLVLLLREPPRLSLLCCFCLYFLLSLFYLFVSSSLSLLKSWKIIFVSLFFIIQYLICVQELWFIKHSHADHFGKTFDNKIYCWAETEKITMANVSPVAAISWRHSSPNNRETITNWKQAFCFCTFPQNSETWLMLDSWLVLQDDLPF